MHTENDYINESGIKCTSFSITLFRLFTVKLYCEYQYRSTREEVETSGTDCRYKQGVN